MQEYHIGTDVYTLHITRGPLTRNGTPITGSATWIKLHLLISGDVPPALREEVLFHELIEAWEFHFPKPKYDEEKLRDWEANVHRSIQRDYARNGGIDALRELEPSIDAPIEATEPREPFVMQTVDEAVLLRRERFAEVPDDDTFLALKARWELLGLDPWSDQFHVREVYNADAAGRKRAWKLVLNLDGYRAIAHSSRAYAGIDEIVATYDESHERFPHKCVATVYRLVDGQPRKFVGTALWLDCFGTFVDAELEDELVRQKPYACLSARAEIAALKKAFAHELRNTTGRDEINSAVVRREAAKPMPKAAIRPAPPLGSNPTSTLSFHMRLIELGIAGEADRRAFIDACKADFQEREDGDEIDFWAFACARARVRTTHVAGPDTD